MRPGTVVTARPVEAARRHGTTLRSIDGPTAVHTAFAVIGARGRDRVPCLGIVHAVDVFRHIVVMYTRRTAVHAHRTGVGGLHMRWDGAARCCHKGIQGKNNDA